jgi:hypothetical protein
MLRSRKTYLEIGFAVSIAVQAPRSRCYPRHVFWIRGRQPKEVYREKMGRIQVVGGAGRRVVVILLTNMTSVECEGHHGAIATEPRLLISYPRFPHRWHSVPAELAPDEVTMSPNLSESPRVRRCARLALLQVQPLLPPHRDRPTMHAMVTTEMRRGRYNGRMRLDHGPGRLQDTRASATWLWWRVSLY